jgi:hypothetical protein
MYLYGLTLQRSAAINCVVYGNFSGPKLHEIVVAHGKSIELLRPDAGGKVISERERENEHVGGERKELISLRANGSV